MDQKARGLQIKLHLRKLFKIITYRKRKFFKCF